MSLKEELEQLKKRVADLEARPVVVTPHYIPLPYSVPVPYYPPYYPPYSTPYWNIGSPYCGGGIAGGVGQNMLTSGNSI